jgi:hypothetical protein
LFRREVTPQGQPSGGGGAVQGRHGDRDCGVPSEPRHVRCAVKSHQPRIDFDLVRHVDAPQARCDLVPDRGQRPLHVEAAEGDPAVAQIDGLTAPGGGPGRRNRAATRAAFRRDFCLHGRPPSRESQTRRAVTEAILEPFIESLVQ